VPVAPIDTSALLEAIGIPDAQAAAAAVASTFETSLSVAKSSSTNGVRRQRHDVKPAQPVAWTAGPPMKSPDHFVALWAGFEHGAA
jgi:hypothetical protein